MMMRSGGSKNPKKNNLAPTYEEVREFEPQAPKIDDYFKRSAEDLCATDLRIKRALVDLTVAGSKHILHLRPYFVSVDDLVRFHHYVHGGVIFAPNHSDFTDILTIGTLAGQAGVYPRFVGKAELPAALTHLGLIPIDRSKKANSGWLKALLRVSEHTLTEEKTPVVIFGEGAIHPEDHKVHEIQPGLLAVSKNAEIVPVGICGAAGLLSEFGPLNVARTATRKHKISVAIGEAISLDDDTLLEKGYELPSRSGDKKDFKSLLVQVLIQEQYNRALESLKERD